MIQTDLHAFDPGGWVTIPPRRYCLGGSTSAPRLDQSEGGAKAAEHDHVLIVGCSRGQQRWYPVQRRGARQPQQSIDRAVIDERALGPAGPQELVAHRPKQQVETRRRCVIGVTGARFRRAGAHVTAMDELGCGVVRL
jgi:hypothetical protein